MVPNCKQENSDKQVFYWDGKSSTDNPSNIELFQKIYDYVNNTDNTAIVVSYFKTSLICSVYGITKDNIKAKIYSQLLDFRKGGSYTAGTVSTTTFRTSISLTIADNTVTKVNAISTDSSASYSFLTTDIVSNFTGTYIPTKDYQPATKKYVDDNIIKARLDGTTLYLTNDGTNP